MEINHGEVLLKPDFQDADLTGVRVVDETPHPGRGQPECAGQLFPSYLAALGLSWRLDSEIVGRPLRLPGVQAANGIAAWRHPRQPERSPYNFQNQ